MEGHSRWPSCEYEPRRLAAPAPPRFPPVSRWRRKGTAIPATPVRQPTHQTLAKYGLPVDEWQALLDAQGGGCGICGNVPPSGTLHIDHEHVRGWKKMAPAERRQYVRGLICWFDNNVLLRRGATPQRLRAAAAYLERYAARKGP